MNLRGICQGGGVEQPTYMCHARNPVYVIDSRATLHTHTIRYYRVNRKNPKFKLQNCIGLDSSLVEC